jgi:hypothetical protein
MKRRGNAWLTLVVVAFCMTLAFEADGCAQVRDACADDIAKFCKGLQPGGGRIAKCLKDHEKELSPACKEEVAEVQKRWNEAAQACHDDVLKFCKDVQPGGGRIAGCLREHRSELSPECQERWLKPRKQK